MIASAWEWVFGPDPGWLRLWTAARLVCTAAMTLTALLLLQHLIAVPFDAIGLGLMVSIFGTVNLRDPTPARQRVTLLILPLPALGGWALAILLRPWQYFADIGFILIVFWASLARMAGPRGTALGMVAYISYLISIVTRSQPSHYALVLLSVTLAVAGGFVNRFLIFADYPAATLDRVLQHMRHRVAGILDDLATAAEKGQPPYSERGLRDRYLTRLRAGTLIAKQQVYFLAQEGKLDQARDRAAMDLLGLELAIERLVRVVPVSMRKGEQRFYLRRRIIGLRRQLCGCGDSDHDLAVVPAGSDRLQAALDLLEKAVLALPSKLNRLPAASKTPSSSNCDHVAKPIADDKRPPRPTPDSKKLLDQHPVRQALQNALSVGLAIGIGSLVSGRRWYWAAIAAFIIGIGVASRGEGLIKAIQRLAGTVIGIIAGLYVGSLVGGHTDLTLALVLVCLFFAFYAFQSAYAVMMFWITIMVALLYSLLGVLQPSLLLLRLEETAIGSAVGVVVIMTLLPLRTHQVLGSALGELLAAIGNVVDQAAGDCANRRDNQKLIAAAWDIAEKTNAVRDAIGPLKRGWERLSPQGARLAIGVAEDLAYAARELAFAAATASTHPAAFDRLHDKAGSLQCELDRYCADIKAAGTRFRCRSSQSPTGISPSARREPEVIVPFCDSDGLLDLIGRELGRLRDICGATAPDHDQ